MHAIVMWLLATAKKSIPTDFQLDKIYDCVHDASKKETPHPRMAQDMLDIGPVLYEPHFSNRFVVLVNCMISPTEHNDGVGMFSSTTRFVAVSSRIHARSLSL